MNHLIIIGFKSVGKSVIGQALAQHLSLPFVDLDQSIETHYLHQQGEKLSCRQIFKKHGIDYFRALESERLAVALDQKTCVLAVGGGTPLKPENQSLIRNGQVIHVQAPKGVVFERIMLGGIPAFFPEGDEPFSAFLKIWDERLPIYQALANQTVTNSTTIRESIENIISMQHQEISL